MNRAINKGETETKYFRNKAEHPTFTNQSTNFWLTLDYELPIFSMMCSFRLKLYIAGNIALKSKYTLTSTK
jgi:hypothetical protein